MGRRSCTEIQNESRRSLVSLCKAIKLYGTDRVVYRRPAYVEEGYCEWCGKKIENKRRTSCCCKEHSQAFNIAICSAYNANPGSRSGYANHILRRDNYTCRVCGVWFGEYSEYGIKLPTSYGKFDIHHIQRVCDGGGDEPENLISVCNENGNDCHAELHKMDYKADFKTKCAYCVRKKEERNVLFGCCYECVLSDSNLNNIEYGRFKTEEAEYLRREYESMRNV